MHKNYFKIKFKKNVYWVLYKKPTIEEMTLSQGLK